MKYISTSTLIIPLFLSLVVLPIFIVFDLSTLKLFFVQEIGNQSVVLYDRWYTGTLVVFPITFFIIGILSLFALLDSIFFKKLLTDKYLISILCYSLFLILFSIFFLDIISVRNIKTLICINYLPQHDFIINTSVIENITLSKSYSINNKVRESMKFANLIDFLNEKDLQQIKINDFGNNLSGGQRRRISLARFFYNKSFVNIIDEPTNALDYQNILMLLKNFKKFSKDCILIIFTHEKLLLKDKSFISLSIKNKKIVQK